MAEGAGPAGTSSRRAQSAVLVPVPDAEALVGPWRLEHDPTAPAGVPAHVTLIVPWLPPAAIGDAELAALAEVAAGVAPWEFDLTRVGWFGRRVLWLAPEPAEPFVALTRRLAERFGTPPWGDEFDEVVPHLTVAHAEPPRPGQSRPDDLGSLAERLAAGLPVTCRASELWVMVGDGWRWHRRAACPIGS